MTSKNYYFVENGTQAGPFSYDELKLKTLAPDTLIWYNGLEKWKRIKDIPELASVIERRPPPISEVEEESTSSIPPIPNLKKEDIDVIGPAPVYEHASLFERFGGYLIVNIITLILFFAFDDSTDTLEPSKGFVWDMIYAGIGTGIINCIFYPFFSGNLGHKLLGLKVIKKSDGSPVNNIFSGYGREFFKGALSILIVPLIWLFFDEDRQNLYDKIQGTIVVKNKD